MNDSTMHAEAETAYALALASDEGLRAMTTVAPPEIVRIAWIMGHYKGRRDGMIQAEVVYAQRMLQRDKEERYTGRAEHDRDTRGNQL